MFKQTRMLNTTSLWNSENTPNSESHKWHRNHILATPIRNVSSAWAEYPPKPQNFPDQWQISLTFSKILNFPDFFQNSLTFPWPWISLTFPWPVATLNKLRGYKMAWNARLTTLEAIWRLREREDKIKDIGVRRVIWPEQTTQLL